MAKFRTTPNEDEIHSYMQSAAASGDLAAVDPRAVKRANSNYPKTRARGVAQVSQQIQVNQAQARQQEQAAGEQRRQDAQAKSVQAEADRAARQQAAQAEAVRLRNVRAAAAAGVRTTTNIETGRRDIATHSDGTPKWKAGPLGDPVQVGTQGTAIQDPQSGAVRTVPDLSLVTGGGGAGGAVSAQGTTTQAVFQQPVRDDRGNIAGATPETKTDAKTGLQLFSKTDPTTGQTVKIPVGFDAEAKAKADRAAVLERDTQAHALRANTFAQAHAAFDPRWQPVKAEYQAARAGWEHRVSSVPRTAPRPWC